MARSRNIKPGFCQNEHLAELSTATRLLFALLPMFADREGRLEDRPKRIGVQVFPYDSFDADSMLQELHDAGFIRRYSVDNSPYIQIVNFSKHQNPHVKEAASTIPAPGKYDASTRQTLDEHGSSHADSLNLVTDSLISDSLQKPSSTATRFDDWWAQYPKKVEKKKCRAIWKRRKLDAKADEILADTLKRPEADDNWKRGFIPNPTTYLNGDRWEDEYAEARPRNSHGPVRESGDERRTREAEQHLRAIAGRAP